MILAHFLIFINTTVMVIGIGFAIVIKQSIAFICSVAVLALAKSYSLIHVGNAIISLESSLIFLYAGWSFPLGVIIRSPEMNMRYQGEWKMMGDATVITYSISSIKAEHLMNDESSYINILLQVSHNCHTYNYFYFKYKACVINIFIIEPRFIIIFPYQ